MRKQRKISTSGTSGEINISPLIDVVFILLLFFIVTTVFIEETGIEVSKPRAVSSAALQQHSILIGIDRDQRVFYGGRDIGVSGVRSVVERLQQIETQPVIIQADRSVPTELLVRIIDEAQLGGAPAVNIATER